MRWKLLIGNLIAVLIVGLVGWRLAFNNAAEALVVDIDPSVDRGVQLLAAVRDQAGEALLDAVEVGAASPELAAVFAQESESARRDAAFAFAEQQARAYARLPGRNRPADLVAVIDDAGRVIARNVERNQDVNRDLRGQFPAVARALTGPRGAKVRDYIHYSEQSWFEVAVVPVMGEGHPRGALLVGFTPADSAARNDASRVGVGVGYVFREGERFTVQSLSVGQQAEKEQLSRWLGAQGANLFGARTRHTLTLGGQEYRLAAMPMPGASDGRVGGAVVLRSLTQARAPATDVAAPVLLATLLGVLLVTAYNLYLALYLQKPIEQIEDGLLQVINGNPHHRIQVEHEELGGVIYRVNQLLGSVDDEDQGEGSS
ncbi:MAG: hypothetical protein R3A48_17965 [Polyangiales bacterium]